MNAMNADWRQVEQLFEELVENKPKSRGRRATRTAPTEETIAEALSLIGTRRDQLDQTVKRPGESKEPAGKAGPEDPAIARASNEKPAREKAPAKKAQVDKAPADKLAEIMSMAERLLAEKEIEEEEAAAELLLKRSRSRKQPERDTTVQKQPAAPIAASAPDPVAQPKSAARMPVAEDLDLPVMRDIAAALEADIQAEVQADVLAQETLAEAPSTQKASPVPGSLPLGSMVGPFRVKSLIVRGAQGDVYSARRTDGSGDVKVALRLLRPEAASRFDRLREDRRMVAALVHPGIARMIADGVASDGRPFIATDFVEGEDIIAYAARRKLNLRARLQLVLALCDAVAYAHQRLALHQDIHPGNVRVTEKGQLKLVDFALARFSRAPEEPRLVTRSMQCYAAPERLKGAQPSMAADIYGIGAVFFELMTGMAPWQPDDTPFAFASRRLNNEPPPASSVRIKERSVPAIPAARLAGDLDAIIGKAMRFQPAERYATVDALAADIRRYLASRAVEARGNGLGYRFRCFLRRNRLRMTVAGTAIAAALMVGGYGAYRIASLEIERRADLIRAEKVDTASDLMLLVFRAAAAGEVEGFASVREVLDRTTVQLDAGQGTKAYPQDLLLALGETYIGLEEYDGATYVLTEFATNAREAGDLTAATRGDLMRAQAAIANLEFEEAASLLDGAEAFFGARPELYGKELATLALARASLFAETGRREDAVRLLRDTLSGLSQTSLVASPVAADLNRRLGEELLKLARPLEAASALDAATALYARNGLEDSPSALSVLSQKALLAFGAGNWTGASKLWEEAIARRRALYGPSDALAAVELSFGRALLSKGDAMGALLRLEDALSMATGGAGHRGAVHAMLLQSRGLAHLGVGNLKAARQDLDQALEVSASVFGEESLYYGMAAMAHAEMSYRMRDIESARADIAIAEPIFAAAGAAGEEQAEALSRIRAIIESISG